MSIKGQVPNKRLEMDVGNYQVGDCFLAAIYIYVLSIYGQADDLLQFAWYFACEKTKQDNVIIRLVHYDEIREYVWRKYSISFDFLVPVHDIDIDKVIRSEITKGRPIGLTVDYKKCFWTRETYERDFVYHFILIIGYSDDFYWCIDNEDDSAKVVKIKDVLNMTKEILKFDDSKKTLHIRNDNKSFGGAAYMTRRQNMYKDLEVIRNLVLKKEKPYYMASKLKLISQNYENFEHYVATNAQNTKASIYINNLKNRFAVLSLLTLKYNATSNCKTWGLIENNFEQIKWNEEMLREELKGYEK